MTSMRLATARVAWRLRDGLKPDYVSPAACGRTNSTIAALTLAGSSTNGSCPDSSNQTSFFEGALSAS
jgi:hypothetical protein